MASLTNEPSDTQPMKQLSIPSDEKLAQGKTGPVGDPTNLSQHSFGRRLLLFSADLLVAGLDKFTKSLTPDGKVFFERDPEKYAILKAEYDIQMAAEKEKRQAKGR